MTFVLAVVTSIGFLNCQAGCLLAQEPNTSQTQAASENEDDQAVADEYPLAELPPLRRIVLYNSGVGQLQHEGKVNAKQRVEVEFGAKDIDNVLKSLVFADQGGGSVRAIEYQPAPEPEDVAASMMGTPMTLAQLVQRFRGESITLTVDGTEQRGVVYGVENRTDANKVTEVIVLMTDEGLHSVNLPEVDRLQFDKPELRETLRQAMVGTVKSREADRKKLELLFDGVGERQVRFAYVVDMPIWRMTYRLATKSDKVNLQGWAHVDNVSAADWNQVALELRSGKPQSFHIDIFSPLLARRTSFGNSAYDFTRELDLETQRFGFDAGYGKDSRAPLNEGVGGFGGGFGGGGHFGGGGGGGGRGLQSRDPVRGIDMESAFQLSAQEGRTSQMVQYVLKQPVDLGAGRSAALPVFSSDIPAEVISVFDLAKSVENPLRAIEITNSTELSIISGPVSVMREGDFVGDGVLGRLDVNEKAEIVFGVDRAVKITTESEPAVQKLKSIKLRKADGIVAGYESIRKTIFRIDNRDTEKRKLVLYHMPGEAGETVAPQVDLTYTDRPRFLIDVAAQSDQEFEVVYRKVVESKQTLNGVNARLIVKMLDGLEIEDSARKLLVEQVEFEDRLSDSLAYSRTLTKTRSDLVAEQKRVRENLEAISDSPEVAKTFLTKLQSLEQQIVDVNESISEAKVNFIEIQAAQKKAIADYFK